MEIFLIPKKNRIYQFCSNDIINEILIITMLVERPENAPTDRQQVEHRIPEFVFSNIYENVYNNAKKREHYHARRSKSNIQIFAKS